MLKLIESYMIDGIAVEIFQTSHSGPDYHVRYGLEVRHFDSLSAARADFSHCMRHARECAS